MFCPEPRTQIILLFKNQILTTTEITALRLRAHPRIVDLKQKHKGYHVYFMSYNDFIVYLRISAGSKAIFNRSPPKK